MKLKSLTALVVMLCIMTATFANGLSHNTIEVQKKSLAFTTSVTSTVDIVLPDQSNLNKQSLLEVTGQPGIVSANAVNKSEKIGVGKNQIMLGANAAVEESSQGNISVALVDNNGDVNYNHATKNNISYFDENTAIALVKKDLNTATLLNPSPDIDISDQVQTNQVDNDRVNERKKSIQSLDSESAALVEIVQIK